MLRGRSIWGAISCVVLLGVLVLAPAASASHGAASPPDEASAAEATETGPEAAADAHDSECLIDEEAVDAGATEDGTETSSAETGEAAEPGEVSEEGAEAADTADGTLDETADEDPQLCEELAADPEPVLYPMVFPIIGPASYRDSFGAPRSGGRTHAGADLAVQSMTPVVAVADGVVTTTRHGRLAGYYVKVRHPDGWETRYMHLNNDTPGTDDGLGVGFAPGIAPGAAVTAGTLLGWVGDSGNAENTAPHLHFELRDPEGNAVNPYHSLVEATQLSYPAGFVPPFFDDDGHPYEWPITVLAGIGVMEPCGEGTEVCPDDVVDGVTLQRLLDLALGELAPRLARDLPYLGYRGLNLDPNTPMTELRGCGVRRHCAADVMTHAEVSAALAVAFALPASDVDAFRDDDGSMFESLIDSAAAAGIERSCLPADQQIFDPQRSVTRGELAQLVARAMGYLPLVSCGPVD